MAEPTTTPAQLAEQLASQSLEDPVTTTRSEVETNAAPTTFHRFLDLPVELREKVYEHAFFDGAYNGFPPRFSKKTQWPRLPALCYTSKLEYAVSTPVLLRTVGIRLHKKTDVGKMDHWLRSIGSPGKDRRAAIKKADVWYDVHRHQPGFATEIRFLSKCGELQEITFMISSAAWIAVETYHRLRQRWNAPYQELTGDALVDGFDLTELPSCINLKRVRILVPGLTLYGDGLQGYAELADQLAEELKHDYMGAHGRDIDVYLVCMDQQKSLKETAIGTGAD